jgi:regulator of replication initiation timing
MQTEVRVLSQKICEMEAQVASLMAENKTLTAALRETSVELRCKEQEFVEKVDNSTE